MNALAPDYERLRPIMDACGTMLQAKDFYWAVNLAYHTAEADVYTQAHTHMIKVLADKWRVLLAPLLESTPRSILWADIGCGPGVMGSIVQNILGSRIQRAVFVDPCAAMIDQCRKASGSWSFQTNFIVGTVESLVGQEAFHLVTADSVLHHVVELSSFLQHVSALVLPDGFFANCFDPRKEAIGDKTLLRRQTCFRAIACLRSLKPILRRMRNIVLRRTPAVNWLEVRTNETLLTSETVERPLDLRSIWAVTDFHVPGQPGDIGEGIGQSELSQYMPEMCLEEYFTYQFFSDAPLVWPFYRWERTLFAKSDSHGMLFGARWKKDSTSRIQ